MAWEVVAAALGSAFLTGLLSLLTVLLNNKATQTQLEREKQYQLRREALQRRLDIRREYLTPLNQSIHKLLSLSGRFGHLGEGVFLLESSPGEWEDVIPDSIFDEFKAVSRELSDFRWNALEPARWWGVTDLGLRQLLSKLSSALSAVEREVHEKTESGGAHPQTIEKARSASEELDGILIQIVERIEQILSGTDLVPIEQKSK